MPGLINLALRQTALKYSSTGIDQVDLGFNAFGLILFIKVMLESRGIHSLVYLSWRFQPYPFPAVPRTISIGIVIRLRFLDREIRIIIANNSFSLEYLRVHGGIIRKAMLN